MDAELAQRLDTIEQMVGEAHEAIRLLTKPVAEDAPEVVAWKRSVREGSGLIWFELFEAVEDAAERERRRHGLRAV